MAGKRRAIDLKRLVEKLRESEQPPPEGWPQVIGGTCATEALLDWLRALDLSGYDVAIWAYTDECTIGEAVVPDNAKLLRLTRARLFGAGGDLDLSRSGDKVRWRYVGLPDHAPQGETMPWPGTPENPVFWRERTALLWGHRPDDRDSWYDDRVAGADLDYPVNGVPERVQVRYYEFTQAGRPFAVWFRGLEGHDG